MNDDYPLHLAGMTFHFAQDGNTLGTTAETEELDVSLETQLPGDPPFFVLKSATGWSANDAHEMSALMDRCLAAWEKAKP